IDGPGQILGQAGPCFLRVNGGIAGLTVIGLMKFDSADLDALASTGRLNDVILHEMGHVLGFGSLWEPIPQVGWTANFLENTTGVSTLGFNGTNALAAFVGFNGGSGSLVPVEDTAVAGTGRSHWKEGVFKNEVMTGYLSGSVRPWSRTTIQSMADLGYQTNPNVADPFDLATATQSLRASGYEAPPTIMVNDQLNIDLYGIT